MATMTAGAVEEDIAAEVDTAAERDTAVEKDTAAEEDTAAEGDTAAERDTTAAAEEDTTAEGETATLAAASSSTNTKGPHLRPGWENECDRLANKSTNLAHAALRKWNLRALINCLTRVLNS
eukprot:2329332-Pleurochrysis_carterae.AAC.1